MCLISIFIKIMQIKTFTKKKLQFGRACNILIMHDGGAISSHGFLLDDIDELESAAEGGVRVWPFGALKVSHLQNIIILMRTEGDVLELQPIYLISNINI